MALGSFSVTFNPNPAFRAQLTERELKNRLTQAGLYLRNTYRTLVNIPYPPASKPGEYPHRRTGRLRDGTQVSAVQTQGNEIYVEVVSTVPYTIPLINMKRLYLANALQFCQLGIVSILTGKGVP